MSTPQDGLHGLIQGASERQSADFDDRPPKKSRRGWFIGIAVVVLIGVCVGLGVAAYNMFGGGADYQGAGHGSTKIVITSGQSLTQIGDTLFTAGVVKSTKAFIDAAKQNPNSTKVAPGTYRLALQMQASLALSALLNSHSRVSHVVAVPEGSTVRHVVIVASAGTGIPASEFNTALSRPSTLGLPVWAHRSAEGFLFPATYTFDPGLSATQVLRHMTARFGQSSDGLNLVSNAARIRRTPYEVVIVASIIEREVAPRDYAKAARVIYNRLDHGMKLQLDSTVAYGLGIKKLQLRAAQLAKPTPYNTYLIAGLPPTPIGNPGDAALAAAAHPATGSWLYFVTVNLKTQETKFSSTYEQFLRDKAEYLNWVAANS